VAEPEPFMVQTLDRSSLFAGKLHAIMAREMAGRVKGRDFYDFIHFVCQLFNLCILLVQFSLDIFTKNDNLIFETFSLLCN
jgi:hypothetical protein